jgi:chromate reductase
MIDWLSRLKDQPFKDKPVAIQSASQGVMGASRMQYHLRQVLTSVGAFVFGTPEIIVSLAQTKFDKESLELTDQPTKDIIKMQLAAFAKFIVRVRD